MFWKKKATSEKPADASPGAAQAPAAPGAVKAEKLPGPKEIPEMVGRYMVVSLKKEPDWVWSLKSVQRPRPQSGKDSFNFRIFNPAQAATKKVKVQDYTSLDGYADLILFQGWVDKKAMQVHADENKPTEPAKAAT